LAVARANGMETVTETVLACVMESAKATVTDDWWTARRKGKPTLETH